VTTGPTLNQYFAYTMDANGNRTRQVVNLTGSTSTGATTTSYAYNSGNELCWKLTGTSSNACGSPPTGATTYTFNQAGDETGGSTGGLSFSYDNAGQTTSFTPAGGSATSLAYLDGGQDQLIANGSTSVANSQLGVSSTTTGGSTTYYGRTPDGTLVDERKPSGRSWYVFGNDVVGSVSGVVSSTGTSNGTWGYTPYGETNGGSGSDPNPFKFAGGYTLPGGYTHFGARHYDPALGRWTQRDPLRQLGDLGQADRYVYAGGSPIAQADPSGACIVLSCDTYSTIGKVGVTAADVGYLTISGATAADACVESLGVGCAATFTATAAADRYLYSSGLFRGSYLRDENGE
jgi:RHS repeat-associated protein